MEDSVQPLQQAPPGSELPWSQAGGLEADARGDAQSTALALVLRLRPERWRRRVPPSRGSLTVSLGPWGSGRPLESGVPVRCLVQDFAPFGSNFSLATYQLFLLQLYNSACVLFCTKS